MIDFYEISDVANRSYLCEKVKKHILSSIFNGEYSLGDRITETNLAKKINVSQGVVREAIRDLESMGIISTVAYKGSYIKSLSEQDLKRVYRIRILLEIEALEEIFYKISKEDIAKLEKYFEQMVTAAKEGDYEKQSIFDYQFHKVIVDAAKNTILKRAWESVGTSHWTFIGITRMEILKPLEQAGRHKQIIESLKSGNKEQIKEEIMQHFMGLLNYYSEKEELIR